MSGRDEAVTRIPVRAVLATMPPDDAVLPQRHPDAPAPGELDAAIARQVKDLLSARVREGATIILTTHILDVAERMAERIGIIQHGKLLAEGTLAELRGRAGGGQASLEDVYLQLVGAAA